MQAHKQRGQPPGGGEGHCRRATAHGAWGPDCDLSTGCLRRSGRREAGGWDWGAIWSVGGRKGEIKVIFVVRSISRESRRDDGDSKVPSVRQGGRYILQLTKSKSDKN